MAKTKLVAIHREVKRELADCLVFWLSNGIDEVNGGVYTCLDRAGKVYSTDKSVWMQGRCAWTFSRLCAVYGTRPEWERAAKSCLDFMEAHCINRDRGGRLYFTVTAQGQPLRQRRYCFSEAFYAMANAEYYGVSGDRACLQRARDASEMIWRLNHSLMPDPAGFGPKTIPKTRRGRALADPMIYLNLCSVLARCDEERAALYRARAAQCAEEILQYHHKPQLEATLETVGLNGEFWRDISAGRVVNPGHDIECAWFLLEHAQQTGEESLCKSAVEMFDFAFRRGWDQQYGGLLYYTDVLGNPPEAYEHDMKLWWPHNELLIASLMIYHMGGDERYLDIFRQTWVYAMEAFSDREYGEWYGYLRRDGQPTQPPAKGSTFKGPFHLPRMLIMVDRMLEELLTA